MCLYNQLVQSEFIIIINQKTFTHSGHSTLAAASCSEFLKTKHLHLDQMLIKFQLFCRFVTIILLSFFFFFLSGWPSEFFKEKNYKHQHLKVKLIDCVQFWEFKQLLNGLSWMSEVNECSCILVKLLILFNYDAKVMKKWVSNR